MTATSLIPLGNSIGPTLLSCLGTVLGDEGTCWPSRLSLVGRRNAGLKTEPKEKGWDLLWFLLTFILAGFFPAGRRVKVKPTFSYS